ncbi:hypothetical protein [Mycobacterium tuberculosis]|uniref:hypothetical protein n=1 Tax=Mycobacterium tuberculosis TaxID=1773 RepID=UPI00113C0146|nr:hypothetical protein [Mycobacterium tuberculosis]TKR28754.1 hypothetical protein FDK48_20335 [Mycobacterium tuberculosis]
MEDIGVNLLNEDDNDVIYQIKTNNNKTVTPDELVVHYPVVLERGERSNAIPRTEVFDKLVVALDQFEDDGDLEL